MGVDSSFPGEDTIAGERDVEAEHGDEAKEHPEHRLADHEQSEYRDRNDCHRVHVRAAESSLPGAPFFGEERASTGRECDEAKEDVNAEGGVFKECYDTDTSENHINRPVTR
ncbi:hypothetical protein ACOZ4F_02375 [Haloarcula marismortui]|uniref:hypothetical protein n=1 Tax=Haloarcula marismortui TaxID=2238 RepID=UPI003C757532